MNQYELFYIVNDTISEENLKTLNNKINDFITNNKGIIKEYTISETQKLAYKINNALLVRHCLLTFEIDGSLLKEFNRILNLQDNILRFMISKK